LDEVARAVDGAVNVAFGREVDHGAGLVLGQEAFDQSAVADVALHKHVPWVALNRGQGLQITRIGELVQVDHDLVATGQPVEHKVTTNKTGAAGN